MAAADPALAQQLCGATVAQAEEEDEEADADFAPGAEEGETISEEYDEGPVVDDERPPFADDDVAAADPALVQRLQLDTLEGGEGAEAEAEDADFSPQADSDVEEEYDEGQACAHIYMHMHTHLHLHMCLCM